MTTSPLSDAEIATIKKDAKYRTNGWQFDMFRMLDAVPRLIAEIEAARRSEPAAGYAMWNAAVEACARIFDLRAVGELTEAHIHEADLTRAARFRNRAKGWKQDAAAIRSLMIPKGSTAVYESEWQDRRRLAQRLMKSMCSAGQRCSCADDNRQWRDHTCNIIELHSKAAAAMLLPTVADDTAGAECKHKAWIFEKAGKRCFHCHTLIEPSAPPPGEGEIEEAILALQAICDGYDCTFAEGYIGVKNPDATPEAIALKGENLNLVIDCGVVLTALRRLTQPQNAAAGKK